MNLMGEVLKRDTGIRMDHVPFRGAAPLVQELLSGRIQFGGDQLSSSLQHECPGAGWRAELYVLINAGSKTMTGAPRLACSRASRGG